MISPASFTKSMTAFSAKIGVSLSPLMATFYERVLSHDFETEDFLRGARIVYANDLTRWPAPHDFSAMIATAAGVAPSYGLRTVSVPVPTYPSVGLVREHLGEWVADAYGIAGPRKLWSDDLNIQQPAIEDFEKALAAAVVRASVRGVVQKWARYQVPPPPSVLLPTSCDRASLLVDVQAIYDLVVPPVSSLPEFGA